MDLPSPFPPSLLGTLTHPSTTQSAYYQPCPHSTPPKATSEVMALPRSNFSPFSVHQRYDGDISDLGLTLSYDEDVMGQVGLHLSPFCFSHTTKLLCCPPRGTELRTESLSVSLLSSGPLIPWSPALMPTALRVEQAGEPLGAWSPIPSWLFSHLPSTTAPAVLMGSEGHPGTWKGSQLPILTSQ